MQGSRSRFLRRVATLSLLLALALVLGAYAARRHIPTHWQVPLRALLSGVRIERDIRIAMPDGVRLAATLYRPRAAQGPLPTVYIRLPYDRERYGEALGAALLFSRHGYAVLVQDVRGKFGSEGRFAPWRHATADGVATLDWIVAQPWSNGKVGTFGCSALGELQYALSRARHPAHAAMIPLGAGGAIGSARDSHAYFGVYEGGVFQLATGFGWLLKHGAADPQAPPPGPVDLAAALRGLPVATLVERLRPGPNAYHDFLRMPPGDPRWREYDYVSEDDRLATPALDINTWGDQTVDGTLALAEHVRAHAPAGQAPRHHVVIAPGTHCETESTAREGRFGELAVRNAAQPYAEWYLKWFDHWLRGRKDALAGLPHYLWYVIGEDRWLSSVSWPPEGSRPQRWYLGGDGRANGPILPPGEGPAGGGRLTTEPPPVAGHDDYVYDPLNPVPSRGGPVCCTGNPSEPEGPADQRDVEARDDVLVYTSPPLKRPLRIAGPLQVHLTISSSAPDTDFVARLVHVQPDGHSTGIQEGALRARYRQGLTRPQLLKPGQRESLVVPMRSIAYLIPAGHRLRLHITSSSFPRLERNLNTGGDNALESESRLAHNRVHHGGSMLSYLELPVLETPEPFVEKR